MNLSTFLSYVNYFSRTKRVRTPFIGHTAPEQAGALYLHFRHLEFAVTIKPCLEMLENHNKSKCPIELFTGGSVAHDTKFLSSLNSFLEVNEFSSHST